MELVDRRTDGCWLREQYGASQRRVCGLMGMAVSSYRYRSRRSDESLRERLVRLAREQPRYGYRRLQVLVKREGERGEPRAAVAGVSRVGLVPEEKEAQALRARGRLLRGSLPLRPPLLLRR
jgi:hypothetical protein